MRKSPAKRTDIRTDIRFDRTTVKYHSYSRLATLFVLHRIVSHVCVSATKGMSTLRYSSRDIDWWFGGRGGTWGRGTWEGGLVIHVLPSTVSGVPLSVGR